MKLNHNYYVYIVQCSDDSYYTGVTNDLENRIEQHNAGIDIKSYTFKRRPVALKYYTHFVDINQAIAWEKVLKGWSRKKKEALFIEDWNEIKRLAKGNRFKQQPQQSSTSSD
ncbi:MAG: GIY-YIG nuclease family protein [Bacteroidetes bacterium]|nr:GIY-YIG nuclease family protein [Bacteroidota bacterium]